MFHQNVTPKGVMSFIVVTKHNNMKTIFHIDFVPSPSDKSRHTESIKTTVFAEVEPKVKEFVAKMKEGDIIEYWKEGKKYIYESMMTLKKGEDGRVMQEVIKGDKVFYKESFYNKA